MARLESSLRVGDQISKQRLDQLAQGKRGQRCVGSARELRMRAGWDAEVLVVRCADVIP